jgi:predicted GIY-YIG superfamily endonuclease
MRYVYILASETSDHFYVGVTDNPKQRLARHNAGDVTHTSKFRPWKLRTYVAFSDEARALAFEKHLKTASGRAFSSKRH